MFPTSQTTVDAAKEEFLSGIDNADVQVRVPQEDHMLVSIAPKTIYDINFALPP